MCRPSLVNQESQHTYCSISHERIKGNQTMKFGQLIEHPKYFYLKIMQKMRQGNSFQTTFCLFFLNFMLGKSKWSAYWFHYISIALKLARSRNKLFKTLHYLSRDMVNFAFLHKGLGIISPANFVYDFSTKMFHMLCSINWPNFIIWLSLVLEILGTCVLQLFFNVFVTSWILKSTWSF